MTKDSSAWTLYWSNNTPQSCIASAHAADAEAINNIWWNFASTQGENASILDLATGNGAVPTAMLGSGASYTITAVDRADIDPLKFLEEPGQLQNVTFMGGVDVGKLPFADRSYDALSSQFGIEYADLSAVAVEVARVLKPGGQCLFLMHHRSSAIVGPNELLIAELEYCLEEDSLIDTLRTFVAGTKSAGQLEEKGQQYLQSSGRKTKQISGQVFEAISAILQIAEKNIIGAAEVSEAMIARLHAEHGRLTQMQQASLDSTGIMQFKSRLQGQGMLMGEPETFSVGSGEEEALVGWLVAGSKPL